MSRRKNRSTTQSPARLVAAAVLSAVAAIAVTGTVAGAQRSTPDSAVPSTVLIGVNELTPELGAPTGCSQSGSGNLTCEVIFDALTVPSVTGKITANLATSWSVTGANRTEWVFDLRKGVKFSDGETFDASSVITTLDFYTSPAEASQASYSNVSTIASTRQGSSPYQVIVTTKTPNPLLAEQLDSVWMLPPKYFAKVGAQQFAIRPVGTGPYKVVGDWTANSVAFTRFTGSWRSAPVKNLKFDVIADDTARLQALESGQIQVDEGLEASEAAAVKSEGGYVDVTPATSILSLQFINTTAGVPVDNAKVRYALNLAINRQAIVSTIYHGYSAPADQGAAPGTFGYDSSITSYPYDPSEAKKLLAAAGYPHGFSMTATITPQLSGVTQSYEAVAEQLGAIGVTVSLNSVPFSQWIANFLSASWGSSQAFSIGYLLSPEFDASKGYSLASCLQAKVFYCDKTVLPLIETVNSTFDQKLRQKDFDLIAKYYYTNPPAVFMVNTIELAGISASVPGFAFTPDGSIQLSSLGTSTSGGSR